MLRQLVYISTAREGIAADDLADILDCARRTNGDAGLTGFLAFGGGMFLQIVEGAPEKIDAMLDKARADKRHANLRVLQDVEIENRAFPGVPMGFRALDPDAARLIAARTRVAFMPATQIAASLGDSTAIIDRTPLAA